MTIADDGNMVPPETPDLCHACGTPVGPTNEYYDVHDDCREDDDE